MWHKESITDGECDALYEAARRAWGEDTRYPIASGSSPDDGQCYVTARWLQERLGGFVGKKEGHYAWLSPDRSFTLDLASHVDGYRYGPNQGFEVCESAESPRAQRFAKRADKIFENLGNLLKHSLDYMGDGLPAEEPQASEDRAQEHRYWHDEPTFEPAQGEYKFVYGNGQLEISPLHDHKELAGHAGVLPDHTGPVAVGYVALNDNRATWEVHSNVNIKALARIFKDYSKHVGWEWGGLTNIEGEPISDEFAPKKSQKLHFVYGAKTDHLWIGRTSHSELALQCLGDNDEPQVGVVRIRGRRAEVQPVLADALGSLYEWAEDSGLTLYAWNDNVLKKIPDLELENVGDNQNTIEPQQTPAPPDERKPSGLYQCPNCDQLFPTWHQYQEHRKTEFSPRNEEPIEDGGFPQPNPDASTPSHFTEMQPMIMPLGRKEAARVDGFKGGDEGDQYFVAYHFGSPIGYARLGKTFETHLAIPDDKGLRLALLHKAMRYADQQPQDTIEAPIPFVYDIDQDNITIGQQGERTAELPGKFTPSGIVEGTYDKGGKITLRSITNMPITIRHMIDLWYAQHPELAVNSVYKMNDDGSGTTKLAADNEMGGYISSLVAADPAAHLAQQALQDAGGRVFAVGGAVRDAVRGKEPKDIDLMVTGLDEPAVMGTLNALPGKVDLTGKDFGVFRYRNDGQEVEIALPRTERSTGEEHKDFAVKTDPHLSPEEDLFRRDFTANAMAVDLSNGRLIDPYGGQQDIQNGVLRTVSPTSLGEDPLRTVRALVANARHGLVPDQGTREQMTANAHRLPNLPAERVQSELDKLFAAKNPGNAIRLAHETGVLHHILPEVDNAFGYDQNNPHHELELGDHSVNVLDRISDRTDDRDLRLAGLLHDIGKPDSAWVDPVTGSNHYYYNHSTGEGADHETVGAAMTEGAMSRLRYPADRIQRVRALVQHHMWSPFTTSRGARRFLQRVGDHANDLMTLRWADQGGKTEYPTDPTMSLTKQQKLIDQVRNAGEPTQRSQLAVNGNDLIQAGIPAGPQMGMILNELTNAVVENPALNTREGLLGLARQIAEAPVA